jgi:nucleoside-diphosphate-sugar epimerase
MNFDNKKVVVVGGAGFVGSNLVKMILNSSETVHVIAIDNLMSAEAGNLPDHKRLTFYAGSITETSILRQLTDDIDYVFHLATYHGNQSSIHDPLEDHANNTYTTLRLFDWIKDFKNLKKIVYSSAGCSVAKKTFDAADETTEDDPIEIKQDSPYSISKIVGEFYAVYYFNQHKLPTVRARFQNVYGPGEVLGAGRWRGTYATVWRNVTPTFVYKALNNLPIPLENSGVATRDFIYVDDICKGLIACALKGVVGDVYNIASGKETTIAQLAETIVELTGSKSKIEYLPKRAWDNSGKRYGSIKKSKEVLGFEAKVDHRDGLKKTIEWTKVNIDRINKCIAKHDVFQKK